MNGLRPRILKKVEKCRCDPNTNPLTRESPCESLTRSGLPDPHIRDLNKLGMNHICFAVDDIEAEVARVRASGFRTRNEVMDFHSRKLIFVEGPEGVTVELSQWH